MKTTITLLIPLLLLNPAKPKNIQKPVSLKPITTLDILENRDLFEFSTFPLKISIKHTDPEYQQQAWKHQKNTVVRFKKEVDKISKPIIDFRLDDY